MILKTKLIGKVLDMIDEEDDVLKIMQKLKNGCERETLQSVTNKLLRFRQAKEGKTQHADKTDNLTASLKRTYIVEGVPATAAETYATNGRVTALRRNAESVKNRSAESFSLNEFGR